jgi:hypothetical protein
MGTATGAVTFTLFCRVTGVGTATLVGTRMPLLSGTSTVTNWVPLGDTRKVVTV